MLRPSCSQCVRAGRLCKGYRDPGDLMFRDESKGLIAKAQRQTQKAAQRAGTANVVSGKSPKEEAASRIRIGKQLDTSIPAGLQTSPEDHATAFFFQNYVPDKGVFPTGGFQYLESIFNQERMGQAVADSIASLGMAGLSNLWKAPDILVHAGLKYQSALKLLSSQLKSPDEAVADQTFAAVMLLGLYETNTCHNRGSMDAWTRHITGATAILKLRGKRKLSTQIGRGLFIHHRSQVIANCLQRGVAVPEIISECNRAMPNDNLVEAAATTLAELYIKYANLKNDMEREDHFGCSEDIISRACAIDVECAEWARTLPIDYLYRTVTVKNRGVEVFAEHYHIYNNLWIAMIWNNYRSLRCVIHELVLLHLRHFCQTHKPTELLFNDPDLFSRQTLESEEVILQSSQEICASVPYILDFNPNVKEPHRIPRAFNGNLLLWPLFVAGTTEEVPSQQRKWVISRLRYISDVMGIRQAMPLVYSLSQKADVASWDGENLSKPDEDSVLIAMEIGQEVARQQAIARENTRRNSHQSLVPSQDYQTSGYQDLISNIVSYSNPPAHESVYPDPTALPKYHVSIYQRDPYQIPINLGERGRHETLNMALGIPNFDEGW